MAKVTMLAVQVEGTAEEIADIILQTQTQLQSGQEPEPIYLEPMEPKKKKRKTSELEAE